MKLFGISITRENRNDENPNDPIDFDDVGSVADSGVYVDEAAALTDSAVWRGASLIARDVAKMPLYTYRRLGGGGKDKATEHDVYSLLRYKPNPQMNAFNFKQFMQLRVILVGNAYAYIERNGAGKPIALWPLNDHRVTPYTESGKVFYEITSTEIGKPSELLPSRDMFHLRGIGNRIEGYSLIDYARDTIGTGLAARKFTSKYFENGARPHGVVTVPENLSDPAAKALKKSWNSIHGGLDNAFKVAVLEDGMTFTAIPISNKDGQLEELVKLTQKQVAQFLNIPLGKMGESESVSYNSAEQENQSYLDNALDPWLVAWESEGRDKLLSEAEKSEDLIVLEFLRESLVRMNAADRTNMYASAIQNGYMTVDEVRGKINMNPFDGGIGSKPFRPLNMVIAGEENQDALTQEPANDDAVRASRAVLCDALRRVAGRWRSKQDAATRKGGEYTPELRFFDEVVEIPYQLYRSLGNAEPYALMRDRLAHEFRTGSELSDAADLAAFMDSKNNGDAENETT